MSLPGLALPEAFATLDSRLESVMQLSVAKGSPEAQVVGLITVCEELKQLLKCAFIGGLTLKMMLTSHTYATLLPPSTCILFPYDVYYSILS